jgi:hypothetical protein
LVALGVGHLNGAGGEELDVPAGEVDAVVVLAAEQDEVGEAGFAAVLPGLDVVALAPFGGPVAAGVAAPEVAQDE